MRTRESLIYRAAKFLGKIVPGETLGSIEHAAIDDELNSIIENLNSRGVTYIADFSEFEDDVFDPLARIIATKVCTDFGMTIANLPGFEGEPRRAESELRALRRESSTADVIRFVNF